jgi:hypothetical protein
MFATAAWRLFTKLYFLTLNRLGVCNANSYGKPLTINPTYQQPARTTRVSRLPSLRGAQRRSNPEGKSFDWIASYPTGTRNDKTLTGTRNDKTLTGARNDGALPCAPQSQPARTTSVSRLPAASLFTRLQVRPAETRNRPSSRVEFAKAGAQRCDANSYSKRGALATPPPPPAVDYTVSQTIHKSVKNAVEQPFYGQNRYIFIVYLLKNRDKPKISRHTFAKTGARKLPQAFFISKPEES